MVHAEVGHQDRSEGKDGHHVEGVFALQAGHQSHVQHEGIDHDADQRPGLLRIPSPVASPALVRPDTAEEVPDGEQDQTYGQRHLVDRGDLIYGQVHLLLVLLVGEDVEDQCEHSKHHANGEGPVARHDDGHVHHEPVGIQYRNQVADRRFHPVPVGHHQQYGGHKGRGRQRERRLLAEDDPEEHGCPGNIDHRLVAVTPGGVPRNVPAYAQSRGMIKEEQQDDRSAQLDQPLDGLVAFEDMDDHHDEHQQAGVHVVLEQALEDVILVVEQLQIDLPF